MDDSNTFDYIVVGAGAGGCVIAARLAEAGKRVLVLEAGGDPLGPETTKQGGRPLAADYQVPAFHTFASENPGLRWDFWVRHYTCTARQERDWRYRRTFENEDVDGLLYPRATGLGGCTGHNAMIFVRPNDADWNHIWQLTGDASWRASNMQKYFQRLERCRYRSFVYRWLDVLCGWNPTGHGWHGWLTTERAIPLRAIQDRRFRRTMWKALLAVGSLLPDVVESWAWFTSTDADPNDQRRVTAQASAMCIAPLTTARHARTGPRDFLLDVARRCPDRLTIRLHAFVTRINIDPDTKVARGVFYRTGNRLYRASARPHGEPGPENYAAAGCEVILAGGAFNSPQLLMLSGVGDAAHLAEHRIQVVKHLPGVGHNLQDRYEVGVVNRLRSDWAVLRGCEYEAGDRPYRAWRRWRSGPYASNGVLATVMFPSRTNLERPDLFCFFLLADFRGYYPGYSERIKKRNYLTWAVLKAYTDNTAGIVRLRSGDPFDPPQVDFRYLREGSGHADKDIDAMVTGIRFGRKVVDEIGHYVVEEETPGRQLYTDEELKQHVEDNAWGHHASCTCPMKPEGQGGVVDSNFQVYGVGKLRVVDASIFPRIPGYFIVSSVYMIAEKAADAILHG